MDCREVVETFNKCGGIFYCDYVSNKCTVLGTNLKCSIKTPEDALAINRLLWSQMHLDNLTINKKDKTEKIPVYHRFQNVEARSIEIDTLETP